MQILPLILFGIATAFSPGPNNIMTSYTAFNFGFKKAIPTMLGVIIGWTLLIILLQLTSAAVFVDSRNTQIVPVDSFRSLPFQEVNFCRKYSVCNGFINSSLSFGL